ncbi:DNA-binding transcriptional regulator of sugar metabolism, DeoR/GlpR family [Devosia crocina]|uniref:DNA-binding transcriptional regulator of sugar metabolism, DeoR/GlpR family n=1 Tax=Devosia crocina TaxID=429728 RepID=A0A1I7NUP2_9HYPH|nr:DeoR/GlpR family DNA-binding transcription regulator [Devosia crocina]SFV38386.1 DNA-binding transcriptional regulator of sugar metabolism, DeoR/GlpR family [Devosia crocina]
MQKAKAARRNRSDSQIGAQPQLLAEPRRMRILEWLQEEGSARVRDLSAAFGVSEATIRQDLERLDNDGFITREHGGAYLRSIPQQVQSMSLQHVQNMEKKKAIGAAAALVSDHDTLIIDSGTTTTQFAENLKVRQELNIITNALNIALILGAIPTNTVHMPAGQFKAPTLSLSGEKSVEFFVGIYAQKLFLATAGVSFDVGLTYPAIGDIYVKRAMIKSASHVYLLADSTKIGRVSFSALGGVEMVNTLITDEGISDADRSLFEQRGVEVLIAR